MACLPREKGKETGRKTEALSLVSHTDSGSKRGQECFPVCGQSRAAQNSTGGWKKCFLLPAQEREVVTRMGVLQEPIRQQGLSKHIWIKDELRVKPSPSNLQTSFLTFLCAMYSFTGTLRPQSYNNWLSKEDQPFCLHLSMNLIPVFSLQVIFLCLWFLRWLKALCPVPMGLVLRPV